jgi:crotonobetainyl-CoA:carnitine CoA-transferase CaiB-like acyl-CoA transferase
MQKNDDSVLGPYRVLDLADEKGLLCGKILGDLGADVIKVEKPGGDAARNIGPFYHDEVDPEKSLYWFALNTSKRGITLDIEKPAGRELFKKLVKTADFVIESFTPGYMDNLGLGYKDLEKLNPKVIMVSISPYGQTGPYSKYKTSDIVSWAAGGNMFPYGDADRPPVHFSHHSQVYMNAGCDAAQGALTALYYRHETGEGQQVDVSCQDSVMQCTEHITASWDLGGHNAKRVPPGTKPGERLTQIWPCKDGHVSWFYWAGNMSLRTNVPMVKWMESEGEADEFLLNYDWANMPMQVPPEDLIRIEEPTARFIAKRTKAELFAGALKNGVQLYPVSTPKDMLSSQQLEARNFWVKLEHPELNDTITYPGSFSGTVVAPPKLYRRAPLIGEHNSEVYKEIGLSDAEIENLTRDGII